MVAQNVERLRGSHQGLEGKGKGNAWELEKILFSRRMLRRHADWEKKSRGKVPKETPWGWRRPHHQVYINWVDLAERNRREAAGAPAQLYWNAVGKKANRGGVEKPTRRTRL